MRYLNNDLKQSCPLYRRLWEARNGLFVGLVYGLIGGTVFLGLLIGLFWLAAGLEQSLGFGTHYCAWGFAFFLRMWPLILFLAVQQGWNFWESELRQVNEASQTLEEVIEHRLAEVNESLAILFDPEKLAELQALKQEGRERCAPLQSTEL